MGNPLIAALLIFTLGSTLHTCAPPPGDAQISINSDANAGRRSLLAGDYQASIEHFQNALKGGSKEILIRGYMARAHLALNQREEALRETEDALSLAPDNARLHQLLGTVHLHRGFAAPEGDGFDDAILSFRRALDIAPESAASHYNLGIIYNQKHDNYQAELAYLAALKIDSTLAPACAKLGLLYREQGDAERAITCLERAVRHDPENGDALFHLGLVYRGMAQNESALEILERAATLLPHSPKVHMHLGQVYLRLGRRAEGKRALELSEQLRRRGSGKLAEKLKPPMGDICISAATAHYAAALDFSRQDSLAATLVEYRNAVAVNPDLRDVHEGMGLLFFREGELEHAFRSFRRGFDLDRSDLLAQAHLGRILLTLGEEPAAREILKEVARSDPALAQIALEE